MSIDVKLPAIDKLRKNLDFDVLVQPELTDAMSTFVGRFLRQGKGLGAQRNTLIAESTPLSATVTSTLSFPRTKGVALHAYDIRAFKAMAPNVIRAMARRIAARFAEASG